MPSAVAPLLRVTGPMAVPAAVALRTAFPARTTGFWKKVFATFTLYPPPLSVTAGPAR
jgi:hypothetical protein